MLVTKLSFMEMRQYDEDHGTSFLDELRAVCDKYAIPGRGPGVWAQLGTDLLRGVDYALRQTLRYVDYGYSDARVFRDLGVVILKILVAMGIEKSRTT
jgi:hypothetical protein